MKKKVLIADDDANTVELLKTLLGQCDCEIFTAKNGSETFNVCRKEKPHIVILDIMMPHFSGYQVLQRLKKSEEFKPHPLVLILSAKSQPEDIKQAEMLGCDAYLVKPFEPQELINKVEDLLNTKKYTL